MAATAPLPDLVLYSRPGCGLCDDARAIVQGLLEDRAARSQPLARLRERDITPIQPSNASSSTGSRSSSSTANASSSRSRRQRSAASSRTGSTRCGRERRQPHDPRGPGGRPDQLPVAVRPAARARLSRPADRRRGRRAGARRDRRAAGVPSRHAFAYVLGFGAVFTLLGITATFASAGLAEYLPTLRVIGGVILVVLGLNLAGIITIPRLAQSWRPLDAGAASSVATATGTMSLASTGPARRAADLQRPSRWPARRLARRLARVLRARGDLRRRLDALHRDHPRRHPRAGVVVADRRPGRRPADRLHARARDPVPADRRPLRSRAGAAAAARSGTAGPSRSSAGCWSSRSAWR